MPTQYESISEVRDILNLLAQAEYYKDMATATLARHTPLNDGAIWAELCKLLDTPMQGYDYDSDNYDSAAYAIRAYLLVCDYYYHNCWMTTPSLKMHELAVELIDDVAEGTTTPRKAAEKWAATHAVMEYGYPLTDENLVVGTDIVYGRVRGAQAHRMPAK